MQDDRQVKECTTCREKDGTESTQGVVFGVNESGIYKKKC